MTQKNSKKTFLWQVLSFSALALLALVEILLVYSIWSLQTLPIKYTIAFGVIFAALDVLIFLLVRQGKLGKWQKEGRHIRQIVGCVICVLLIAACLIGVYAVSRAADALDAITNTEVTSVTMHVYVLADDPAESLEEARDYTFGISNYTDSSANQGAIADIEESLGSTIAVLEYANTTSLVDALYDGEIGAMIMDSAYVTVLPDMVGYEDFEERVRLITEHQVTKEVEVQPTGPEDEEEEEQIAEEIDVTTTPFIVYISGNDARSTELADGGSDVNILMVVNPVAYQILMINTPRDYYVVNPASGDGSKDKLSHCGLNGIDNCVEAMEILYDIDINYYARINFTGFQTLVDAVGGVTVYSEYSFSAGGYSYVQGYNTLNGAQALMFARERKAFLSGDNQRGKNQMALIKGLIDQLSVSTIISNYSDILDSLEGMFATTMSTQDIGKLVDLQLTQSPTWDVLTFAVTGSNGNDTCWAVDGGYGYVMYPYDYLVDYAEELIGRVLAGEVLTEEDMVAPEE